MSSDRGCCIVRVIRRSVKDVAIHESQTGVMLPLARLAHVRDYSCGAHPPLPPEPRHLPQLRAVKPRRTLDDQNSLIYSDTDDHIRLMY
jgi:hypothetical protein